MGILMVSKHEADGVRIRRKEVFVLAQRIYEVWSVKNMHHLEPAANDSQGSWTSSPPPHPIRIHSCTELLACSFTSMGANKK